MTNFIYCMWQNILEHQGEKFQSSPSSSIPSDICWFTKPYRAIHASLASSVKASFRPVASAWRSAWPTGYRQKQTGKKRRKRIKQLIVIQLAFKKVAIMAKNLTYVDECSFNIRHRVFYWLKCQGTTWGSLELIWGSVELTESYSKITAMFSVYQASYSKWCSDTKIHGNHSMNLKWDFGHL